MPDRRAVGTRTPLPNPESQAHQTTSMLRHLSIRDFVIVAALDLEFDSGFTVFSGETGAGKSILIDALALALGARADASVVRTGESRADITAEFETHAQVEQWLDEQALGTTADDGHHGGTVMLRRVVDANGRSRAFINGTAATLAQLREVGEMLVDIHGQHAHQLLMRPDAQRELFDTHAGLTETAAAVTRAWRSWRDKVRRSSIAQTRDRELQLERERLAWQLTELDKLSPQPGEWEEVNAEHRRLSHSANLIDGVQGALGALSESDEAMITHLASIVSKVRDLAEIDPGTERRAGGAGTGRDPVAGSGLFAQPLRAKARTGSRPARPGRKSVSTRCIRPHANSACNLKRCPKNTKRVARNLPRSMPPPISTASTRPKPKPKKPSSPKRKSCRRRAPRPARRWAQRSPPACRNCR